MAKKKTKKKSTKKKVNKAREAAKKAQKNEAAVRNKNLTSAEKKLLEKSRKKESGGGNFFRYEKDGDGIVGTVMATGTGNYKGQPYETLLLKCGKDVISTRISPVMGTELDNENVHINDTIALVYRGKGGSGNSQYNLFTVECEPAKKRGARVIEEGSLDKK